MDELLTQFLIEGRDLVQQAEADLGRLARDPRDETARDSLFRAIHTLKGSVGLFDMAPVEAMLHRAEDRLSLSHNTADEIDAALVDALLGCIDQVDRWIDELERDGRIGDDADERTMRLMAALGSREALAADVSLIDGDSDRPSPDWIAGLRERMAAVIAAADSPLVAFHYRPDADCFFRGDDPLALVAAVPGLVELAILPRDKWSPLEQWDPFRCDARIEGLSLAPIEDVGAAFRLVPDQIEIAALVADQETVSGPTVTSDGARGLRVDATRLETLATNVGELIVATNALAHAIRLADAVDPALAAPLRQAQAEIDRVAGRLHHSVGQIRRVSLAATVRRLPRLVREIAQSLGKPVRFAIRGETTEVDKAIADSLFEPLLHLVRNALDHGIETPERRHAAGKIDEAALDLLIERHGEEVVLTLSDDGGGIDTRRIRELAVERGLISAEAVEASTDAQALRLILLPGFSTAATVTDLSGRGVGMDAVQAAVGRLGGRIVIDSEPGVGTRIALRIPLDAITTRLLIVRTAHDRYGIPLDQIVETARVAESAIMPLGAGRACVLRDRTVPVIDLQALLGGAQTSGGTARLVITESAGAPVAIRVDGFETQIDALVRETTGLLAAVPGVSGTTILGDGAVLLVLDLPELVA